MQTVFKAFSMDKLSAQKFEQENIYHVRSKVVNLAEKLNVSGVFQAAHIIEWCINELDEHCTPENPVDLDFVHCHLILDLININESVELTLNGCQFGIDTRYQVSAGT